MKKILITLMLLVGAFFGFSQNTTFDFSCDEVSLSTTILDISDGLTEAEMNTLESAGFGIVLNNHGMGVYHKQDGLDSRDLSFGTFYSDRTEPYWFKVYINGIITYEDSATIAIERLLN